MPSSTSTSDVVWGRSGKYSSNTWYSSGGVAGGALAARGGGRTFATDHAATAAGEPADQSVDDDHASIGEKRHDVSGHAQRGDRRLGPKLGEVVLAGG